MEVITCLNRFLGLPHDTLKLLFSNIDINLTVSLIEAKYANNGRGRRRFPMRSMLLALMFMRLRLYRLYGSFVGGLGNATSPGRSAGLTTNTDHTAFSKFIKQVQKQ